MISFFKNFYVRLVLVILILLFIIPAVRLIQIYFFEGTKDYVLEVGSKDDILTKYVYHEDRKASQHFSNLSKDDQESQRTEVRKKQLFLKQYDSYLEEINKKYGLIEDGYDRISNYFLAGSQSSDNTMTGNSSGVLKLDLNDVNVVSSLKKLEVLQQFSDTGNEHVSNQVLLDLDEEAKKHDKPSNLSTYYDESLVRRYERPVTDFLLTTVNKFYTSPPPNPNAKNGLKVLHSLKLVLDRSEYYRFQLIRLNLITDRRVNLNDLKVYVRRGNYLVPNVGGRHDIFFRYKKNTIYSTVALGYNPPSGKYTVVVKSASNPNWEGLQQSFQLKRRIPPKLETGFSVINWEYGPFIKNFKIMGLDQKLGNYENILKWVNYMDMDAFWILSGQTTGWDKKVTPKNPWGARSTERSMLLLADDAVNYDVQIGAYVMSYYTPANGKLRAGYAPSLGYDSKTQKLEDSAHISLQDQKRLDDIIELTKTFQTNPKVHFIGLDFIRTGRADGYEMGPQVVEDMNIATPRGYEKLSVIEKIKWFASKVENLKNHNMVVKWRWWRAHRVATIVNTVIREAKITKPVWVFTLGWYHGKQHGQDPYMFFDAGVFADAVMLYEANRIQFKNMMVQWGNYMRDSLNNIVIGNAADIRFLDNRVGHYGAEYIYRSKKAYRSIYKEGLAKGIFLHDLSRAFWSSKRGFDISEWAVLHGHSASAFRNELGIIPYKGTIEFDEDLETGEIIIENTSNIDLIGLKVVYSPTPAWKKISDNIPSEFSLRSKQKITFKFSSEIKPDFLDQKPILGYYITHPNYLKYFFLTFRDKHQKKLLSHAR